MTNNHLTFQLPVGYTDEAGTLHREVELKALSGKEEELLSFIKGDEKEVTASLLACCIQRLGTIQPFTTETARNLSPADRCFLLLKLWETTFGSRVRATVTCPGSGCGEKVDIDFSTADIPVDEFDGLRFVLELEAHCHDCGQDFVIPYDFYRSFFARLRAGLDRLYREVHCLAYHYHWSEREIMEMPRNKRHKYLEILADEIERMNNAGESQYVIPYHSTMNQDRLFIEDSHGPGINLSPGDADDPTAPLLTQPGNVCRGESGIRPFRHEISEFQLPGKTEAGILALQHSSPKDTTTAADDSASSPQVPLSSSVVENNSHFHSYRDEGSPGAAKTIEIRDKGEYKIRPDVNPGNVGRVESCIRPPEECATISTEPDTPHYEITDIQLPGKTETGTPPIQHSFLTDTGTIAKSSLLPLTVASQIPLSSSVVKNSLHSHSHSITDEALPGKIQGEHAVKMSGTGKLELQKSAAIKEKTAESKEPGIVIPGINEIQLPDKTKAGQSEIPQAHRKIKAKVKRKEVVMQEMHEEAEAEAEADADARIRQIRRETSRLKKSNQDQESESPVSSPSHPVPGPSVQAPVFAKSVTGNIGRDQVPCAFWERNSLTRFHLNILR